MVQTACEGFAGTDAYLELKLTDAQGRWYRTGYLDNPGDDLGQCTQDVYDLGTWQWVDPSTMTMQVYFKSTSLIWGEWRPAWIQVGWKGSWGGCSAWRRAAGHRAMPQLLQPLMLGMLPFASSPGQL